MIHIVWFESFCAGLSLMFVSLELIPSYLASCHTLLHCIGAFNKCWLWLFCNVIIKIVVQLGSNVVTVCLQQSMVMYRLSQSKGYSLFMMITCLIEHRYFNTPCMLVNWFWSCDWVFEEMVCHVKIGVAIFYSWHDEFRWQRRELHWCDGDDTGESSL